ncbi:hypothetical protein OIDMADRAFT_52533 [Oidiodendron maius Zn]|uniref:Uncharacterized protein n=1 Tax=Oidiodendron maius (strain Zn) TaxID=913774 RepID=A0A0C3HK49_OIDMZ|nr:hypothetical protein OIDMADRAFT_52533 [Oidiodendron maius Zn]
MENPSGQETHELGDRTKLETSDGIDDIPLPTTLATCIEVREDLNEQPNIPMGYASGDGLQGSAAHSWRRSLAEPPLLSKLLLGAITKCHPRESIGAGKHHDHAPAPVRGKPFDQA